MEGAEDKAENADDGTTNVKEGQKQNATEVEGTSDQSTKEVSNEVAAVLQSTEATLKEEQLKTVVPAEEEKQQPLLWRDSLKDGYIAVRNFSIDAKELQTDQLKNVTYEFDKVVVQNINTFVNYPTQQYSVKSYVYHPVLNVYMQVKKYDDTKKVYLCKPRVEETQPLQIKTTQLAASDSGLSSSTSSLSAKDSTGLPPPKRLDKKDSSVPDMELRHDEISDQINVTVRVLTENNQVSGLIQVGIHDKIVTLKEYFTCIKSGGGLNTIYKNELIKNDDTFFKKGIKSGEFFMLISGSFEAKKWKRFPKVEHTDYFYMSESCYDAVIFKPKMDIYFLGFGVLNQYEKKNFKLKFKYDNNGSDIPEVEFDITQDMLTEEQMFEVDFQKIGIAPVQVKADTPLHIMAKATVSGPNRFNYGYDGSNPDRIEGQEQDFIIERSDFNQNSTSVDFGQFPYILYAK